LRPNRQITFEIPVLLVHYFPTKGNLIDRSVTGDVGAPLDDIRTHTRTTTAQVIEALEQGSRFRAYKHPDSGAQPALHDRGELEFLEPLPTWRKPGHRVPMTDYNAIMARIDAADWVRARGVKEIWMWGYHGGVIDLWESNMAGPWGDISNSDRDPHDLPVFDRTYTVYHYNYGRGPSEGSRGSHAPDRSGAAPHRPRPLLEQIRGQARRGALRLGALSTQRRARLRLAQPHRRDERHRGLAARRRWAKIPINCDRWQGDSLRWFIYWMQSLPGADNGLTYRGRPLTNWWSFIGDFDGAMRARLGLVA
jgi:hypothetical protein